MMIELNEMSLEFNCVHSVPFFLLEQGAMPVTSTIDLMLSQLMNQKPPLPNRLTETKSRIFLWGGWTLEHSIAVDRGPMFKTAAASLLPWWRTCALSKNLRIISCVPKVLVLKLVHDVMVIQPLKQ